MATLKSLAVASTCAMLALTGFAWSQTSAEIPPSITTPDRVETRIGALEFKDGAPSEETVDKVYDNIDFTHAFEAFVNTFQGVNAEAINQGFASIGVKDNELLVFSKLMDASSLFLTANADTVYFVGASTCRTARWCSKPRRRRSARSTTPGGAGSSISARPVPIAARAESI